MAEIQREQAEMGLDQLIRHTIQDFTTVLDGMREDPRLGQDLAEAINAGLHEARVLAVTSDPEEEFKPSAYDVLPMVREASKIASTLRAQKGETV